MRATDRQASTVVLEDLHQFCLQAQRLLAGKDVTPSVAQASLLRATTQVAVQHDANKYVRGMTRDAC